LSRKSAVSTPEKSAEQKIRIRIAATKTARVVTVIFYDMDPHAAGSPLPHTGEGRVRVSPGRADELVVCSLSELRAN
jgi:hypothetical protein